MEYPVGISYAAWGTAWLTHWVTGSPDVDARASVPQGDLYGDPQVVREIRAYVAVNAVLLGIAGLLAAWFLARTHRDRPWDAALYALSPALLVNGLVNWDLLAVATVAGALWAWSRDRPVLTGLLIGLGTATKLYPLFLLGGILVICLRRRDLPTLLRVTVSGGWGVGARQRAGVPHRPRRVEGLLDLQLRPWRRPRQPLAGGAAGRAHGQPAHHQHGVLDLLRRLVPGRLRGRACSPRRRRGSRSSASWSWPASCWSTRSTHRSTSSGCCRWRCWPGRAGATS